MIVVRDGGSRGHTQLEWLDSWHTFSFGDYQDPAQMGFRALRVIGDEASIGLQAVTDAEVLLFDL
jgi:redox-sensitive bicupin YhaK (pirin superfamily)